MFMAAFLPSSATAPTTALRAVPLPGIAGEENGPAFPPLLAGEGDHAKRGGGGTTLGRGSVLS